MNILVFKLDNGGTSTHFLVDQAYGSRDEQRTIGKKFLAEFLPEREIRAFAQCDADRLESLVEQGASLEADIFVDQRMAIPAGASVIPPTGVNLADVRDTDYCVYYQPAA